MQGSGNRPIRGRDEGPDRGSLERQLNYDRWQRDMQRKLEWEAKLRDSYPGSQAWRRQVLLEPHYFCVHQVLPEEPAQSEGVSMVHHQLIPPPLLSPIRDCHCHESPRMPEDTTTLDSQDHQPDPQDSLETDTGKISTSDSQHQAQSLGQLAQIFFTSGPLNETDKETDKEQSEYEEKHLKVKTSDMEKRKHCRTPNVSPDRQWYEEKKRELLHKERLARERYWLNTRLQNAQQQNQSSSPQPSVQRLSPQPQMNQAPQAPLHQASTSQQNADNLNMHQHIHYQQQMFHYQHMNSRYYQRRFYYQSTRHVVQEQPPPPSPQFFYNFGLPRYQDYQGHVYPDPGEMWPLRRGFGGPR